MYAIGSTLYDHPVAQAQDGIVAVESYALTQDERYLDQALADAHRLVDRRVESRGAWFYPYPFDFALHGDTTDVIRTPWYSAMAQGQALTLFARLYDQTQDPQWLFAVRQTLTSLDLGPAGDPTVPFVSWVDDNSRLWLEEYAQQPLARADRTVNGHMFAMFGLWDAVRVTGDPEAVRLFRGAAATMRRYIYDGVRRTFWMSAYCLTHQVLDAKYHEIVAHELLYLNALTGSVDWARFADRFRDDYPDSDVTGTVVLEAGTVTGYRFAADGSVLETRSIRLSRRSSAPGDRRERIRGRAFAYHVTAGMLAGYEVMESYPAVRMQGMWARVSYPYQRVVTFPKGPASTYVVDETTGALSSPRSASLSAVSSAHFDRSAWIGGRPYVHIVDGWFADRWAPSSGLTLT
ncbi:MAG TPA: D-glucuronyl C5-epimerase family protein [Angustibacter sp.]|nr:D-glucuronyl C5-epimerase family protein [Angustibacter sp.]